LDLLSKFGKSGVKLILVA